MQISSKRQKGKSKRCKKNQTPTLFLKLLFPKFHCTATNNKTHNQKKGKKEREVRKMKIREKAKILCHISQWDQLQQIQSNQAQDLRVHPFVFLLSQNFQHPSFWFFFNMIEIKKGCCSVPKTHTPQGGGGGGGERKEIL